MNANLLSIASEPPRPASELLDSVLTFLNRFCVFPNDHCGVAVALWAVHTHMAIEFHTTPRLALLSPEAGSGKTRVLEILDLLVADSMFAFNASPPAIFRTLAEGPVTLLFDEVDAIWRSRGRDDSREDLRALINAGYKQGTTIPRCVGSDHGVTRFPVFCPVALAGLGNLPDTIMSRSIIIRMRRRAPSESVQPFRPREHSAQGHALREEISAWAHEVAAETGAAHPEMPKGIVDRPAEVWEPLIAIADAAGQEWPRLAREACIALCKSADERQPSLGVRLLADLRTVFGDSIALPTETILERLRSDQWGLDADAPWADLNGSGLCSRSMAKILRRYEITPTKVKVAGRALRGYRREDLWETWVRYLPPLHSPQTEPMEPMEPQGRCRPSEFPEVPEVPEVPLSAATQGPCNRCEGEGCAWCAARPEQLGVIDRE